MKKVSVIIPVHNNEETLESLILSLLNLSDGEFEFIFGDDASTDRSKEILSRYIDNRNVKIFFHQENYGAGKNRNILLGQATGEFIAIQDADDNFDPNRFYKQRDFLLKNSEVDVLGTAVAFEHNHQVWGKYYPKATPSILDWILQKSVVHASIMFRSKIKDIAQYHEELDFGEDYFFLTKLYWSGVRFKNLQEIGYFYNVSKDDLRQRSKKHFYKILKSQREISKIFPFYLRFIFLIINRFKLILNYLRVSI